MFHQVNPYSEAQAQNNAYCYENEPQQQQQAGEHQQRAEYDTRTASSQDFASVFATLYSNPSQMTPIGGNFVENQDAGFYQQNSSGYYTIQQQSGLMMHQGQSASPSAGFTYTVDYNAYNQDQQQQQQQTNADTCYMGGAGDNSHLKSDYIVSKEQREAASLTHFYMERCTMRQAIVEEGIKEILPIVQTLLKDVEQQEPRFVYQLMGDGTDDNSGMLGRQGEGDTSCQGAGNKFQPPTLPNGMWQRIPSIRTISTQEFQIILFLNQMAVFNCIDDGTLPGYAALKLCDGRKRSMSLWVEFITASGYLSAKKLRSRFHTLLMNAVEKQYSQAPHIVRFNQNNGSLLIYNKYVVSVTPGFRCRGCWPASARSVSSLPTGSSVLYMNPADKTGGANGNGNQQGDGTGTSGQTIVGFTLIANEIFNASAPSQPNAAPSNTGLNSGRDSNCNIPGMDQHSQQQRRPSTSADSDTWQINIFEAETNLLTATGANSPPTSYAGEMPVSGRIACLRALKTLRDHVEGLGSVTNHQLATLVLWEWEKHPNNSEWLSTSLPDRIRSILLQLINCLQNQRLDHYLLANVNILNETPASNSLSVGMSQNQQFAQMARKVWQLLRQLTYNFNDINKLI